MLVIWPDDTISKVIYPDEKMIASLKSIKTSLNDVESNSVSESLIKLGISPSQSLADVISDLSTKWDEIVKAK